mmetsp:Transcript_45878/g.92026  ORF Transcript_45878/g.92026 Transcript_45878/m.92026 type:complete len:205 (-) Transcript_45878:21-635(-)
MKIVTLEIKQPLLDGQPCSRPAAEACLHLDQVAVPRLRQPHARGGGALAGLAPNHELCVLVEVCLHELHKRRRHRHRPVRGGSEGLHVHRTLGVCVCELLRRPDIDVGVVLVIDERLRLLGGLLVPCDFLHRHIRAAQSQPLPSEAHCSSCGSPLFLGAWDWRPEEGACSRGRQRNGEGGTACHHGRQDHQLEFHHRCLGPSKL